LLHYGLLRLTLLFLLAASLPFGLHVLITRDVPDLLVTLLCGTIGVGVLIVDVARTSRRVLSHFRAGRFDLARRGTEWLLRFSFRPGSRATLELNLAACHLAAGEYELGGEALRAIDREALDASVEGIWENNFAYYLLSTGGPPREALALVEQSANRNPANPAFRSTRGIALLALGRVDDAIAELQLAVDTGAEHQGPAAMAENYFHLARAWDARGESAYARDHFLKALNVGPQTLFGRMSAEKLRTSQEGWPDKS
jgi:tetratricopeptide (TPR) repeat protein